MFQSINQLRTRLPRILLVLICCAVALLPLAALADGTGVEPPIQAPDPNGSSAEDGLILLGLAILSTLMTIP